MRLLNPEFENEIRRLLRLRRLEERWRTVRTALRCKISRVLLMGNLLDLRNLRIVYLRDLGSRRAVWSKLR
jgi:hypothetical protein